jgi:hypothetical protein
LHSSRSVCRSLRTSCSATERRRKLRTRVRVLSAARNSLGPGCPLHCCIRSPARPAPIRPSCRLRTRQRGSGSWEWATRRAGLSGFAWQDRYRGRAPRGEQPAGAVLFKLTSLFDRWGYTGDRVSLVAIRRSLTPLPGGEAFCLSCCAASNVAAAAGQRGTNPTAATNTQPRGGNPARVWPACGVTRFSSLRAAEGARWRDRQSSWCKSALWSTLSTRWRMADSCVFAT